MSIPTIITGDWNSVRQAIQYLDHVKLGEGAIPSYVSMVLSGLTANKLVKTNSSKQLVSTDIFGFVTGTAKRVTVSDDGDGTVTLSGPQDLDTVDSPAFANVTATGDMTASGFNIVCYENETVCYENGVVTWT